VRYQVPAESLHDFMEAMTAVRQSRLRTGGHSWRLYHSAGQPDTFLERFTVGSWTEFERQRTERWLEYDTYGIKKAISFTVDRDRMYEYFLALRIRR
ncbi:MFS transporter, partial [Mycobacterium sp.]|uniref:MFS transporter n=1 Tax=Mycobacterium sp. TaxID=1785 RepID=UPI002C1E2D30